MFSAMSGELQGSSTQPRLTRIKKIIGRMTHMTHMTSTWKNKYPVSGLFFGFSGSTCVFWFNWGLVDVVCTDNKFLSQILEANCFPCLYSSVTFWNFRFRLVRELLVDTIFQDLFILLNLMSWSRYFGDKSGMVTKENAQQKKMQQESSLSKGAL